MVSYIDPELLKYAFKDDGQVIKGKELLGAAMSSPDTAALWKEAASWWPVKAWLGQSYLILCLLAALEEWDNTTMRTPKNARKWKGEVLDAISHLQGLLGDPPRQYLEYRQGRCMLLSEHLQEINKTVPVLGGEPIAAAWCLGMELNEDFYLEVLKKAVHEAKYRQNNVPLRPLANSARRTAFIRTIAPVIMAVSPGQWQTHVKALAECVFIDQIQSFQIKDITDGLVPYALTKRSYDEMATQDGGHPRVEESPSMLSYAIRSNQERACVSPCPTLFDFLTKGMGAPE